MYNQYQTRRSSDVSTDSSIETAIAQAWQAQLIQATHKPALAATLLRQSRKLYEQFVAAYHQLLTFSRPRRRKLLRTLGTSLAGAALILAVGHTPIAYADTIDVTTTNPTIAADSLCSLPEAIINANNDATTYADCAAGNGADIITLSGNTYALTAPYADGVMVGLPPISSTITIAGADATIARDDSSVDPFSILAVDIAGELTLEETTITGGLSIFGGGILNSGIVQLTDSKVSTNTAYLWAGGGILNAGVMTLTNSIVSGNEADSVGGGIFNAGVMTLTNSTVSGNTSLLGVGGGIYTYGAPITAAHASRVAKHRVAGQHLMQLGQRMLTDTPGELVLVDSHVISNTAYVHGGGIFNGGGTVVLTDSSVISNTAINCCGGGIYNGSGDLTLNNSTISGNRADNYGGGIYNNAGYVTLNGSTVMTNTAGNIGGGIASYSGTLLLQAESVVIDNAALNDGGGIDSYGDSLTLIDSRILDNWSGDDGGGIDAFSSIISLLNSSISGNTATAYGGGLDPDESAVELENSTMDNNHAGDSGGAIYLDTGSLTLRNSTISNNDATLNGGGIGVITGTVTLENSTISSNAASNDGGGLFTYGAVVNLSIDNSTIAMNTAANQGGGLFNTDDVTLNLNKTVVTGNTATNGGSELYNTVSSVNAPDSLNLLGNSSQSTAQAFTNFTPDASDIIATSDGAKPKALAAILNTTLANNGGDTLTHVLVGGSPAIDAAGSSGPATDQRGITRPQGPALDIGAVEVVEGMLQSPHLTQQAGLSQTCVIATAPYVKQCTVAFTLKNTNGNVLQINSYRIHTLSSHIAVLNGTPNPGQVGTIVPGVGSVAANATFQPTFKLGLTTNTSYTIRFHVYGYVGVTAAATGTQPTDSSQLVDLGEFEITLNPDAATGLFNLFLPTVQR